MSVIPFDNFDTDFYAKAYPDLQVASQNLRGLTKAQFLYNHYMRHGRQENRAYRLRTHPSPIIPPPGSTQRRPTPITVVPHGPTIPHHASEDIESPIDPNAYGEYDQVIDFGNKGKRCLHKHNEALAKEKSIDDPPSPTQSMTDSIKWHLITES